MEDKLSLRGMAFLPLETNNKTWLFREGAWKVDIVPVEESITTEVVAPGVVGEGCGVSGVGSVGGTGGFGGTQGSSGLGSSAD